MLLRRCGAARDQMESHMVKREANRVNSIAIGLERSHHIFLAAYKVPPLSFLVYTKHLQEAMEIKSVSICH